jgi:hypothetical protein
MVTYKALLVLAFITGLLSLTDSTNGKTSKDIYLFYFLHLAV